MNILYYKYIIEVEKTRSITQAAENLFMAQPNLSKIIKEAEEHYGYKIFERTPQGVFPTKQGNQFLKYAKNIVSQLEHLELISKKENENMQSFNISIPRGSYIAKAFTNFVYTLDTSKNIDINLQETNSMKTIDDVSNGHFNFGIVRYQKLYEQYFIDYLANNSLSYEPIWEFEYVALMSKNSILATKDEISFDELRLFVEIIHGDSQIPYLQNENIDDNKTSKIHKKISLYERYNQFDLLSTIPNTFMWVSPIPSDILERYNLVQKKCNFLGNKCRDILIYHNGYKMTKLDQQFIHSLYEVRNEVSKY